MKDRKKKGAAPGQERAPYIFDCNHNHITKLIQELESNGLTLASTGTATQCATLIRTLKYLGGRGINTFEATAAGYVRLASRVHDLDAAGWLIASWRESVIGPDGLFHHGVARYILMGRKSDYHGGQLCLALEVAA